MYKGLLCNNTKVFWFSVLLVCFSTVSQADTADYSSGLLFRVYKSPDAISYLFGTMHSDDERVLALAEPVREAMGRTRRLVLEMDLNPGVALASMAAMILSDGRDLQQILGERLYSKTQIAAEGIGIPEIALRKFKPWAIATMLSLPPSSSGKFLDVTLYQQAVAAGIEVIGLESAEEQLAVFDQMSEKDQVTILEDTLVHLERIPDMLNDLMNAYLARDLQQLVALSSSYQAGSDPDVMQRFEQAAVIDRNTRMAQRLLPILQQAPTVVAVGALHLPGEEGLLNLLSRQGFVIEKVF